MGWRDSIMEKIGNLLVGPEDPKLAAIEKKTGITEKDIKLAIEEHLASINDVIGTAVHFSQLSYNDGKFRKKPVSLIKYVKEFIMPDEELREAVLDEIANIIIPNIGEHCDDDTLIFTVSIERLKRLIQFVQSVPTGMQLIDLEKTCTYPNERGLNVYDATKNTVVNTDRYMKLKTFFNDNFGKITKMQEEEKEKRRPLADGKNSMGMEWQPGRSPNDITGISTTKGKMIHILRHFEIADQLTVEDVEHSTNLMIYGIGSHGFKTMCPIDISLFKPTADFDKFIRALERVLLHFNFVDSVKLLSNQQVCNYIKNMIKRDIYDCRYGMFKRLYQEYYRGGPTGPVSYYTEDTSGIIRR